MPLNELNVHVHHYYSISMYTAVGHTSPTVMRNHAYKTADSAINCWSLYDQLYTVKQSLQFIKLYDSHVPLFQISVYNFKLAMTSTPCYWMWML